MSLPGDVRRNLYNRVHEQASAVGWDALDQVSRSRQYDLWVRDDAIGGVLQQYMAPRRVRVYLKDSVMRKYKPDSDISDEAYAELMGLDGEITKRFEKPKGLLAGNGIICWGPANGWKVILMSCFERAQANEARPHGVLLLRSRGNYALAEVRSMIEEAAGRLGIEHVIWMQN